MKSCLVFALTGETVLSDSERLQYVAEDSQCISLVPKFI